MPFDLRQTKHIPTKTENGGVQRVIAKEKSNKQKSELMRQNLAKISQEFSCGDFSDPAKIYDEGMPGQAELRRAREIGFKSITKISITAPKLLMFQRMPIWGNALWLYQSTASNPSINEVITQYKPVRPGSTRANRPAGRVS
jgi:hypothetical protein